MLRNKIRNGNVKETLQLPKVVITEYLEESKQVPELHIKNLTTRLRTSSETSQESATSSSPRNGGRRSKRFEEALLKWQEYGNDIIERKPPNFLELNKKPKKGAWIYAGGKYSEQPGIEEKRNERDKLYQKQVKELSGRLSDNLREFEEMHARSAKIEITLKQLKEKVTASLKNEGKV